MVVKGDVGPNPTPSIQQLCTLSCIRWESRVVVLAVQDVQIVVGWVVSHHFVVKGHVCPKAAH